MTKIKKKYKALNLKTFQKLTGLVECEATDKLGLYNVINISAAFFGVTKEELMRRTRKVEYVKRREMVYALLGKMNYPCSRVAFVFKYDHTSILHSHTSFVNHIHKEPHYRHEFIQLYHYVVNNRPTEGPHSAGSHDRHYPNELQRSSIVAHRYRQIQSNGGAYTSVMQ